MSAGRARGREAADPGPAGARHPAPLCPRDDHGDGGDADGSRRPRAHRVGRPRAAQVRGPRARRAGRRLPRRGECPCGPASGRRSPLPPSRSSAGAPAARSPRFSARAPSQRKATDRRAAGGERGGKGPQAGAGERGWRPCGARGDTPPVAGPTRASPTACTEKGKPESTFPSSPGKPDLSSAAKSAHLLSIQFSSSSRKQVI